MLSSLGAKIAGAGAVLLGILLALLKVFNAGQKAAVGKVNAETAEKVIEITERRKEIREDVHSDPDAVFDKLRDRARKRDK